MTTLPPFDQLFATFKTDYYDLGRAHPKGEHVVEDFIDRYKEKKGAPDLIIILSALWDINRWGPRFVEVGLKLGEILCLT